MKPLTIPEISRRTHLTEGQLRGMCRRGQLESIRLGSRVYVTPAELTAKLGSVFFS
jgi:hypothetical protein